MVAICAVAMICLKIVVVIYFTLIIRRESFYNGGSCCYSFYGERIVEPTNLHLTSSVWEIYQNKRLKIQPTAALKILLILSGDIETCPGPQDDLDNTILNLTKSGGINFFHQNIRGLYHNLANLQAYLDIKNNVDVFSLSETHIQSNSPLDNDNLYNIPGYKFLKVNRENGGGGGVAMYISENISFIRRKDLETNLTESLWIEIVQSKAKNLLVGCIYKPPESSLYINKYFTEKLNNILSDINKTQIETIMLGDYNVNYLNKTDNKAIKEIIRLQGFEQIINKPTRTTKDSQTLIDLIFTNRKQNIVKHDVIPLSLSDHDCIGCVRKLNHERCAYRTITCRNYSKYDKNLLLQEINNHDWCTYYSLGDVNKVWQYFKSVLTTSFQKHAPITLKRVKGNYCPWLSPEIKKQMNSRDSLLRKARKSKNEDDWAIYRRFKNTCNNMIRRARNNYHQNKLIEHKNNPKMFWQHIKNIFPCKSNKSNDNVPFLEESETPQTSQANTFCSFFASVASSLKKKTFPLTNFVWRYSSKDKPITPTTFNFKYVSTVFVEKELKTLKIGKAAGLDNFPPRLLKDVATVISNPLSHLINLSLISGTVPSEWKVAKLIPIHKSGRTTTANNYRPISILPILSKILERAVHSQLTEYLEENNLLSSRQFGF